MDMREMDLREIAVGGSCGRMRGVRVRAAIAGHAVALILTSSFLIGAFFVISTASLFSQNPENPAQNLQSSDDQQTIRGTVVNAVTHLPIARALVHSADDRYAVMSDSDGHFEFLSPSGTQVWLLARKPGFLGDRNTGRAMQASSGSEIAGREITIALTPESVIKGRVSASAGEATAGIPVQLL